jgi:hypothetical protein
MLSRHDQEQLAAIESALTTEHPQWADKFTDLSAPRRFFSRRLLAISALVFLGLLTLVCAVLRLPLSAMAVGALELVGILFLRYRFSVQAE